MNEHEYQLDYFQSNRFHRQKCSKCGAYFWSRGKHNVCGEAPCREYEFIGKKNMKISLDYSEMRERYLSFFEKNGHTRINRYPIIARWRDDVFFTQASIYDFQPWVLNGTIEPPANPLTISQPCLRFNDIDNVGKNGRHCTEFEMMAHHTFNKKDAFIYFKDRTVELCDRLLTVELGIDPEIIIYKEEWWEGGGNAGPSFSVGVMGLELATLVFMMYDVKNSTLQKMSMEVVDTGYGLERFTWLSQGTPTAYDCAHKEVFDALIKKTGVSFDEKIVGEYAKIAGLIDIETRSDLEKIREETAKRLGIAYKTLIENIIPLENIYLILDHSRAVLFLLNDGVVPSNVQHGYYARLLIRRIKRACQELKLDIPLTDIILMQIDALKKDYLEFLENKTSILKIVTIEEQRYEETLKRGKSVIDRLLNTKHKTVSTADLIGLYTSHGLTPEIVKEISKMDIVIPDNFYKLVSEMHELKKENVEKSDVGITIPKKEDAILCFDKALSIKPDYEPALYYKARVLESLGKKEEMKSV